MNKEIPKEQFALLGWAALGLKDADDGEEFYYMSGRYQGYREAIETLRNDEVGWPDEPELADAYAAVGRSIVEADDRERAVSENRSEVSVQ